VFAVSLSESNRLAGPLAEEIQFCTPCFAASNRLDIEYVRRMKREDSLHAFVIDDSPHRKGLVNAPPLSGDYRAGEYLNTLFVAFSDSAMNINHIAYFKMRCIFPETLAFDGI